MVPLAALNSRSRSRLRFSIIALCAGLLTRIHTKRYETTRACGGAGRGGAGQEERRRKETRRME